jgi:hypothetical protein
LTQNTLLLLAAVIAQVALVFVLAVRMAMLRGSDFRAGLDPQAIALGENRWSPRAIQAGKSFSNQFELPVLFYVAAILFLMLGRVDLVAVALAWLFVIARIVQAWIHNTSNIVIRRGAAYGIGLLALLQMWIWLAVRIVEGA